MKLKRPTRPFCLALGILAGALSSGPAVRWVSPGRATAAAVVDVSTRTLPVLGQLADAQTRLSDVLMRFSHYTDQHPSGRRLFCPECSGRSVPLQRKMPLVSPPTLPTLAHALDAAVEIHRGSRSLLTGMQSQHTAALYTLRRMRERAARTAIVRSTPHGAR